MYPSTKFSLSKTFRNPKCAKGECRLDIATQNPELRKNLDTDEGVITGVKLVDLENQSIFMKFSKQNVRNHKKFT